MARAFIIRSFEKKQDSVGNVGIDPRERGNRWVIKMAMTSGAERISLIVLWDGKPSGEAPGGTAQRVEFARKAGNIRIEQIDANQLLR